jgi:hypothetical protein
MDILGKSCPKGKKSKNRSISRVHGFAGAGWVKVCERLKRADNNKDGGLNLFASPMISSTSTTLFDAMVNMIRMIRTVLLYKYKLLDLQYKYCTELFVSCLTSH